MNELNFLRVLVILFNMLVWYLLFSVTMLDARLKSCNSLVTEQITKDLNAIINRE